MPCCPGSEVKWESHHGSNYTTKCGVVIDYIPAGSPVNLPEGLKITSVSFKEVSTIARYLIKVITGDAVKYYAPHASVVVDNTPKNAFIVDTNPAQVGDSNEGYEVHHGEDIQENQVFNYGDKYFSREEYVLIAKKDTGARVYARALNYYQGFGLKFLFVGLSPEEINGYSFLTKSSVHAGYKCVISGAFFPDGLGVRFSNFALNQEEFDYFLRFLEDRFSELGFEFSSGSLSFMVPYLDNHPSRPFCFNNSSVGLTFAIT